MLLFILFLLNSIVFTADSEPALEAVRTIDLELVNPVAIVQNEGLLLIYDAGATNPFVLYDIQSGEIIRFGRHGRGPGEIHSRQNEISMSLNSEQIIIHEEGQLQVHIYQTDGTLNRSIQSRELRGMMNFTTSEGYIYNFTSSVLNDELIRVLKIVGDQIVYKAEIEFDRNKYKSLYYNSMNKQASFVHGAEGELYAGLLYSSLLFSATTDGYLSYATFEPFSAPLPPASGVSRHAATGGIALSSPDARNHPFQYKDIAVNSEYVIGLYSGQQIRRVDLIRSAVGGNIRIGEGRNLVLFDRLSGDWLKTYYLDDWTAGIAADQEFIYALNNSREPHVRVYRVPVWN